MQTTTIAPLGTRRPRGESVWLNSSELDQMAIVTESEQQEARIRLEDATLILASLLIARTTLDRSKFAAYQKFLWDADLRQYRRAADKTLVERAAVIHAFDGMIGHVEVRLRALTDKLIQREITLLDWQNEMLRSVKSIHAAANATARGGWAQTTPLDWQRHAAGTRIHFERVNLFARQLQLGIQPLDGRARSRAGLYARAARTTRADVEHSMWVDYAAGVDGTLFARRVLGDGLVSESCEGCRREEKRGWVPVESVARIGSLECFVNCNCHIEYKFVKAKV